jgi:hypothetical protein
VQAGLAHFRAAGGARGHSTAFRGGGALLEPGQEGHVLGSRPHLREISGPRGVGESSRNASIRLQRTGPARMHQGDLLEGPFREGERLFQRGHRGRRGPRAARVRPWLLRRGGRSLEFPGLPHHRRDRGARRVHVGDVRERSHRFVLRLG